MDLGLFAFKKSTSCGSHYWQKVEGRRRREEKEREWWGGVLLISSLHSPFLQLWLRLDTEVLCFSLFSSGWLSVVRCLSGGMIRAQGLKWRAVMVKWDMERQWNSRINLKLHWGGKQRCKRDKKHKQLIHENMSVCYMSMLSFSYFFICCFNRCFVFLIL